MQEYLVPTGDSETEFIERRSRFIGRIWLTETEEEAVAHIKKMREQHWDATHNVYAYIIGDGAVARYSDDGEPQGTSGMPTLNAIRMSGITDVCVVITRYFGGILLGAGGLVRAYSTAASMALEAGGVAVFEKYIEYEISCSYPDYQKMQNILFSFDTIIDNTDFGSDITLSFAVTDDKDENLQLKLYPCCEGFCYLKL